MSVQNASLIARQNGQYGFGDWREGVRIRSGCRRCAARSVKAEAEMYIKVLKGVKLRPPAGNMSSNVGAGRPWG